MPGTPRWAVAAAYATVASVLPAGIWRTLVGVGVELGWTEEHLRLERIPGYGTLYVITLTVLSIGCAALTLGLVYPWDARCSRPGCPRLVVAGFLRCSRWAPPSWVRWPWARSSF